MSLLDAIYKDMKEQDIGTETAVDVCSALHGMSRRQQWVFLRRVEGYTQVEIGEEIGQTQPRISEMIQGPLHAIASLLSCQA